MGQMERLIGPLSPNPRETEVVSKPPVAALACLGAAAMFFARHLILAECYRELVALNKPTPSSTRPASDWVPYGAVKDGDVDRFVVVTGGPGSGKTTLLEGLGHQGWASTLEAGRGVIRDQTAIGGSALPGGGGVVSPLPGRASRAPPASRATPDRGVPAYHGRIRSTKA